MHNCVAIKIGDCYHIRDLDTGTTIGYIFDKLVQIQPTGDGFFGVDEKGVGYVYDKNGCFLRNEY